MMLSLHLVLLILHMQFTINTKLDKIKLVTLNTTFSVDFAINPPKKDGSNTKLEGHDTSKISQLLIWGESKVDMSCSLD